MFDYLQLTAVAPAAEMELDLGRGDSLGGESLAVGVWAPEVGGGAGWGSGRWV